MPISAPSDLSGLTLWIEGRHIGGMSDGQSFLTTIPEAGAVSGVGSDLTWTDDITADVPYATYQTNVVCGEPAIRFHVDAPGGSWYETASRRVLSTGGASPVISESAYTAYSLFRLSDEPPEGTGDICFLWTPDGLPFTYVSIAKRNDTLQVIASNHTVDLVTTELLWTIEAGEWYFLEVWHEGGTLYGRLNRAEEQSIPSGDTMLAEVNREVGIGFAELEVAPGYVATLDIAADVIYDRALTETEKEDLRAYFTTAYACLFEVLIGPAWFFIW
jgi:hypothetical protein